MIEGTEVLFESERSRAGRRCLPVAHPLGDPGLDPELVPQQMAPDYNPKAKDSTCNAPGNDEGALSASKGKEQDPCRYRTAR